MPDQGRREGQIFGSYRLLRFLGKGGFGEVYLAEHLYLQTQAAVKLLSPRSEQERQDLIRAEARTSALLIHPHIVRILDFGFEEETPYLVMPYAPNGTLRSLHPHGTTLAIHRVALYVQQMAEALQFAHNHKIVHRDVKPENMLLGSGNQLWLSDFGVAIAAHSTASLSTQEVFGTAAYMAPEQSKGYAQPAADQYALAVCAYEWLAGHLPFEGASSLDTALMHRLDSVPPIGNENPDARLYNFSAIEKVVRKALEKDPRKRFPSIKEFALALIAATCEETTQQGSASIIYKGHLGYVCKAAWSPNGQWIATGGGDGTVQVWDASTGEAHCTYLGHTASVNTVAWSPDGTSLASGGEDATVQVWHAAEGKHLLTYRGHSDYIDAVAWSPDGKRIASASEDRSVQIWDVATGTRHLTYYGHADITTEQLTINALSWSPSGFYLASGGEDKTAHIWDAATGKKRFLFEEQHYVDSITWAHDGTQLVCTNSAKVNMYDAKTGAALLTYLSPKESIFYAAVPSPNGKYIASAEGKNGIRIWETSTGEAVFIYLSHSKDAADLAWSPNGQYIVSIADTEVHVWQAMQPVSKT